MTERIISVPPPLAQSQPVAQSPVATTTNPRSAPIVGDSVDEEPYTIKCICAYYDDDGNTIYCETCDTWQHIECFYPGHVEEASRDDFNHYCADCKPRELDRRRAYERQTEQRQDNSRQDDVDKKARRPPSKSHKKKPKPSDVVLNGLTDNNDSHHGAKSGSPHDHTSHAKKSKSHHRSQQSVSSQPPKQSPSNHSRSHSQAHPLSPATTPPDLPRNFPLFSNSSEFRKLCNTDPGAKDLQANSFASLAVTDAMSLWVRDKDKLRADTNIQKPDEVFEVVKHDFNFGPKLQVNSKEVPAKGTNLHWRFLSVQEPLQLKDALVGELKGFVGFQKDYVKDDDAYAKLCHPAPFVFFHPRLPLYIDTRKEGSQCRYIRRSCRANTTLDTRIYITNQSEYHFCFVAEQRLSPDTPITMPWDFRFPNAVRSRYLQLLGLADDGEPPVQDITPLEYEKLKDLIHNVLSNYGGCACDRGSDCAFVRFHRNFGAKLQVQTQVQTHAPKSKKSRRPKQHVSPISTGHATNSRDASEGRQELYDAEDDSRSASGSTKPRSRDMTPLTAAFDANGAELVSDRDKRKLADIEKTFEQMDKQPPKKKKRGSDGPMPPAPSNGHAATQRTKHKSVSRTGTTISAPMHANDMTQFQKDRNGGPRRPSESPVDMSPKTMGAVSSKPGSRLGSVPSYSRQLSPVQLSNFVESAIQLERGAWIDNIQTSPCTQAPSEPKKKCSWHRRRTIRKHQDNAEIRESRSASLMSQPEVKSRMEGVQLTASSQPSSPNSRSVGGPELAQLTNGVELTGQPSTVEGGGGIGEHNIVNSVDALMPDAPPISSETAARPPLSAWPGALQQQQSTNAPPEQRTPELRIQMPTVPPFSSNAIVASPSNMSAPPFPLPSPGGSSIAQSPLGTNYPSSLSPTVSNSIGTQPTPPITKKMNLQSYMMRKKLPNASATPRADP